MKNLVITCIVVGAALCGRPMVTQSRSATEGRPYKAHRQTSQSTKRMVHWPENPINYANAKSADSEMLEQIDMVEITDVTAGGKSVTLGQPFEADDEWLKTLSVRIKNVSQVSISKVQMNFFLPQLMPGGPLVALCYGCGDVGKGDPIDPGEEAEMKLFYYSWLLDQINSKSSLSKITKAEVWHMRITTLDGRQFVSGCIKTADRKNACPKPKE
jgi:hypothetical protein